MTDADRQSAQPDPHQATAQYMTVNEVAELLRTPAGTLRYWRHLGKGPASFKLGRRILYTRRDVEDYIAQLRQAQDVA